MNAKICALGLLCTLAFAVLLGCNQSGVPVLGDGSDAAATVDSGGGAVVSKERANAARLLQPGIPILVDLLQFTGGPGQDRCYPVGNAGLLIPPWPSRPGFPVLAVIPQYLTSEYDVLVPAGVGETETVLSIRTSVEPNPLAVPFFSSVEFNFRTVNPFRTGHVPGAPYTLGQANFPSNDDVVANRSLIDINFGGDVAVVIRGLPFQGFPANTRAYMNNLGSTAWMCFMRDNAYQSGRFFAIDGAWTGGPRALLDTPNPADDGFFQSVQVNGDTFDTESEPVGTMLGSPAFRMCTGAPTPGRSYSFLDYGNVDNAGAPSPGRGGFIFIMRREAFNPLGFGPVPVVIDPSANPFNPPTPGNVINPPPTSGYNEPIVPLITAPDEDDNRVGGVPGVHELAVSVFFIHT